MKKAFLFLAVIILSILQLTWPGFLVFFHCKPDFLLVFAVSAVFYLDFKSALIAAVIAGLAKDIFLPGDLPINTILFSLWSYLVYRLSQQISTDSHYVRLAIVLIAAFFNNIATGLWVINSGNIIPAGIFIRNLIIPPVYSTVLSPLVFKLIKKITA